MTLLRLTLFSIVLVATAPALTAQEHRGHRHPSGAKILMSGTLVEPICRFARQLAGSALARCAEQRRDTGVSLILLPSDSALYLLATDGMSEQTRTAAQKLIGREVRVNGTVFRAANGYVILLDSLWAN